MPSGLLCLHNVDQAEVSTRQDDLVDIVAVHSLNEDSVEAWTDDATGINWLQDLLPKQLKIARILTYGYDASYETFFGAHAASNIQRIAHSFLQQLQADRRLEKAQKRPIIFICHGLGGVLVKKTLIFSSSRTASHVHHLWSIFLSTFAILFFGTPHDREDKSNWFVLEGHSDAKQQHDPRSYTSFSHDLNCFHAITDQFPAIDKRFRMFFFWEEIRTQTTRYGSRAYFIVDQTSAVPEMDNIEKSGIHATHSGMIKFNSIDSSSYRTVLDALTRYCEAAPRFIPRQWDDALQTLAQIRASEAYGLGGVEFDVRVERPHRSLEIDLQRTTNRYFYPPQEPTPGFVGREEMILALHSALFLQNSGGSARGLSRRKSFIVYGMGGSGKTEFCSKFAQDYRDEYFAVFTVRAASAETIKESYAMIGKLGGLEATESAGRHWLSQLREPWLLIIDNADDPSCELSSIFPQADSAHILVTTRNPEFRRDGTVGSLELQGLKEEDALQLLLTRADISRPWDVSTRTAGNLITKSLGYLALALIHAGNCIYRRICNLGDFLTLHSTYRARLQQQRVSTLESLDDEDMVKVIYSTFDVSMEFLSKKRTVTSQDASELLKIVGFYHFERIPVDIFTRAVVNRENSKQSTSRLSITSRLLGAIIGRFEPPKTLPGFLKDTDGRLNKFRVNRAIRELHSLSLITYDGKDDTFSLHPLVHAWARDVLPSQERKIWAYVGLNTLLESVLLPSGKVSESDGDFNRDILPHLDSCLQDSGHPLPETAITTAGLQMRLAKFFQPTTLLILRDQTLNAAKCGYVFAERGEFGKGAIHLRIVKDTLITTLGREHEKTMTAMLGLAGVCWGLGRLEEAIELQKTVVEIRSRRCGPTHEETLMAMDRLGSSYWLHGRYHEALQLQEATTEGMKATLGMEDAKTLAALDNLAVTLGSWHRFEESLRIHRRVLKSRQASLGQSHVDTLTTMNNVAMALLDLGHLDEAKSMMTDVHSQRRAQLGKEHPWTLWALCNLAKVHIEMGYLSEAEKMLTWGVEAGERSLGKDHLGVLMGNGQLARIYARQGRLEESEKLSVLTIGLIEKSRGIAHPDTVYGLWKLAQLYELRDEREIAVQTCQLALERADMRITRRHPLAKKIEELLGRLDGQNRDFAETAEAGDGQNASTARALIPRGQTW
ncbi:hypothetical protein NA57DRAFT_36754 [Rhizodiscina lignyota]|uniref:NB-ARC domain-containing protein n=1 Tax=Rhizodiscina lignyota TaxID=1504668 RepID=A0A9P4MAY8_9PEZI|nr:hypothetical protein NA57DRAFT_36754 [Rhizodiscina lignyota]